MSQTLLIRADASRRFGQGHTLRNRNLADAFLQVAPDTRIIWAATAETFALVPPIAENFQTIIVPDAPQREQVEVIASSMGVQGAQKPILVTDGYHLDHTTLDVAREFGLAGVSIFLDEKRDRMLGNQSFVIDFLSEDTDGWRPFTGPDTEILAGPTYQMVSPRFAALADARAEFFATRAPDDKKTVLMMNGGFDIGGMLVKICDQLGTYPNRWADTRFKMFAMSGTAHYDELVYSVNLAKEAGADITLYTDEKDIPAHFASADLFVGAAGMTPYELGAAGGIPSVVMGAGHNQNAVAEMIDKKGAGFNAGPYLALKGGELMRGPNAYSSVVHALDTARRLLNAARARRTMSFNSRDFCDGQGAHRVARQALSAHTRLTV